MANEVLEKSQHHISSNLKEQIVRYLCWRKSNGVLLWLILGIRPRISRDIRLNKDFLLLRTFISHVSIIQGLCISGLVAWKSMSVAFNCFWKLYPKRGMWRGVLCTIWTNKGNLKVAKIKHVRKHDTSGCLVGRQNTEKVV